MIEEAFLRDLDRNDLRVHRPYSFKSFSLPENVTDSTEGYPVTVELTKGPSTEGGNDGGEVVSINCKYLVGCDGGRSAVRQLLMDKHGVVMTGEYVDTLWGALDAGESGMRGDVLVLRGRSQLIVEASPARQFSRLLRLP
jgi:phenol 2-monooxygenase